MSNLKRAKPSTKTALLYVLLSASVLLLALLCFSSSWWPAALVDIDLLFSGLFVNRVSVYLNDRKFVLFFCNVLLMVVAVDFRLMGSGSSDSSATGKNRGVYDGFYLVRNRTEEPRSLGVGKNAGGHSFVEGGGEREEEVEEEEVLLVIEEEEQGEEEVEETEEEVTEELGADELKRKFDEFIENFKRERRTEAQQLFLVGR